MSFDPNTPAAATPAAPTTPSTPASPSFAPQPATPAVTPQSATPTAPATPSEDRSNWVPPYRLREVSSRHEQALAQERATFAAERAALQRQLQALTGVLPQQESEFDTVKNQFKQVFPELSELGSQADAIKELIALKDEMRATMQNQWASHNRNAMNSLYKAAETTYGQALNADGQRALGAAFIGHLQSNPDAYEQYQSDPGPVVEAFWTQFTDRFISPIQRAQTVATVNRIPQNIPQDPMSGAIPVSNPVKPQTQDERLSQALAQYKSKLPQGF
jgi:uncharacterized protein (UPF0335 family)